MNLFDFSVTIVVDGKRIRFPDIEAVAEWICEWLWKEGIK